MYRQPLQIGRALSFMGAVSIFLKLCMPGLLRRYGTLNMFDFCMFAWVVTFAAMPLASWAAQSSTSAVPVDDLRGSLADETTYREASTLEWTTIGCILFLSRLGCLAFSYVSFFPLHSLLSFVPPPSQFSSPIRLSLILRTWGSDEEEL